MKKNTIINPVVIIALSKVPFPFPLNPYLKTDDTSLLNLFLLKNFEEKEWYFVTKIVQSYCNCSSDREKLLKFEAEGQEFSKVLRSLEQFIQTVKGQNNFW